METLELIRLVHEVDRSLVLLAGRIGDAELKERVLSVEAAWRELSFPVSATFCGLDAGEGTPTPTRRRRRRLRSPGGDEADGMGRGEPATEGREAGAAR